MSEKEKEALKKALDQTEELTDKELNAVAGGDCQFCQTCVSGQTSTEIPV